MKKKLLPLMLLCVTLAANAYAQLFTPITDAQANLTAEEMQKLTTLRANPDYESLTMVQVGDVFGLQQNGVLSVNLPGHPTMNAVVYDIENNDKTSAPEEFVWNGNFYEFITNEDDEEELRFDGSIQLMRRNGEIFGTINPINSTDLYELASFAPGKNVLIKMNTTVVANLTASGCAAGDQDGVSWATTSGDCNRDVRVLVLATEAARASVVNINNTAAQAMQLLNGAIYNSTNHAGGINFIHTNTYFLSNSQLKETYNNRNQTYSDLINSPIAQYLRDNHKADIVVFLTKGDYDNNTVVGYADPASGEPTAYAIVDADWANQGFTFSHEIGHLFGARHQQQSLWYQNYDNSPGEAHGYLMTRGLFGQDIYLDIMATKSPDREHMYSTPDVKIRKKEMGKAGSNNVTKTMLDRVCTVSEYRSDNNQPAFKTGIVTNGQFFTYGQTVVATPRVFNNYGTLTHEWWLSTDGGVNYYPAGTTSNLAPLTFAMPVASNVIIWLKTTSAAGQYEVKTKVVSSNIVWGNPNCCSYFNAGPKPDPTSVSRLDANNFLQVTPNPAKTSLTVTFPGNKKFAQEGKIELVDAIGRVVYSSKVPKSAIDFNIDATKLDAGIYFLKFTNGEMHSAETIVITQ